MQDIDTIFQMLSSLQDPQTQEKGLAEGKKVKSLSVFFQPAEGKIYWENCAKIIAGKQDRDLREQYVYPMLLWLRDINWPGAEIIFERLRQLPPEVVEPHIEVCLKQATALGDAAWCSSLNALKTGKE